MLFFNEKLLFLLPHSIPVNFRRHLHKNKLFTPRLFLPPFMQTCSGTRQQQKEMVAKIAKLEAESKQQWQDEAQTPSQASRYCMATVPMLSYSKTTRTAQNVVPPKLAYGT